MTSTSCYCTFKNRSFPRRVGVNRGSQVGVAGRESRPDADSSWELLFSRRHFARAGSVGMAMLAARSIPRRLANRDEFVEMDWSEDRDGS